MVFNENDAKDEWLFDMVADNSINAGLLTHARKESRKIYITEEQANTLKTIVNRRAAEILYYDVNEMAKYFRTFVRQLWIYLKGFSCGAEYRRTRKRNYQTVVDRVEAWIPKEGIQGLKDKVDKKAEAKRKAIQEGY